MIPNFNPNLLNSNNQLQTNPNTSSAQQQVMGNPVNFLPNPMQIQPQMQMGMNNPQLAMPFNIPNSQFAPNQRFPSPQFPTQNLSLNPFGLNSMNNGNNPLMPNLMNQSQFLPNGQVNLANLAQTVTQLLQMQLQMQMANSGPIIPQNPMQMQMANSGAIIPQNPNVNMNAQHSIVNSSGALQQQVNGNPSQQMNNPHVTQQLGMNSIQPQAFGSPRPGWNQNKYNPGGPQPKNNPGKVEGFNNMKNNWKNSQDKKSYRGFDKRQFHQKQNGKGSFSNENHRKGQANVGPNKFDLSDSGGQVQVGKKRSLVLNYTEQEIRQWREERRKNYPSRANIEKRLKNNAKEQEVMDIVAKTRRQQLKEILAKQAELGFEVAEIPDCYLSDSEQQAHGKQANKRPFGKRERFQNKFNKHGRFHQNDRFQKWQRPVNLDSENLSDQRGRFNKRQRAAKENITNHCATNSREPSLLQKLLSSDIRRDKTQLLQSFRFMVMNSFFKDWPEKPLKFPNIVPRESGDEGEIIEEKSIMPVTGTAASTDEVSVDGNEAHAQVETATGSSKVVTGGENECPEEEGEICN